MAATLSTVKPNLLARSLPGADAPNERMPTVECAYFCQPSAARASTASTGTPGGKTLSWYAAVCSSKSSQHGKETTWHATSASCFSAAETIRPTSEPVAASTS